MKLTLKNALLGGALLLTLLAVLFVGKGDDDEVVAPVRSSTRHVPVVNKDSGSGIALEKINRAVMSVDAQDMFAAKSWYVPPPPPPVPKGPPPPPVAPPLPFVYIGKMLESDGKAHVFVSKQDRVYSVSEGETLDRNYSVDSINGSLMTLTYLPLHVQQTLKIGESN